MNSFSRNPGTAPAMRSWIGALGGMDGRMGGCASYLVGVTNVGFFIPPKELWEVYGNRTVRPSVSPSVCPSIPLSCPVHISYIL